MSRLLKAVLVAAVAAFHATAGAQSWPARTVTLVVPFAAGGPTDVVARTLAASMTKTLGQSVVVENKVGAGGTIAANAVAKANPDGYTVFIHHNGMATATALYRKLPYNPLTDFEYIGQVADVPMTLLAKKDLPPDNLRDFIAYVKANKDKINLANAGLGAVSQLCGMLFMQAIGVELTTIPFQGTGPAMTAQTIPQIKAQKVKVYGVTTRQRIAALPEAPTLDEQGLKDFEVVVWHGVYAPKGTPREALDKLNEALRLALKDPAVASKFADLGAQIVPEAKQTPAGLRDWLKSEIDKWGPIIKKAGVYAD
jgi:tripartite-type tricarboxylate transporter receptor subunit TctC